MNALWLERLYAYRQSPCALESAKILMTLKDERRLHLLNRYGKAAMRNPYDSAGTFEALLLNEARNAKAFWGSYETLLPPWTRPFSRRPGGHDAANKLLDIGYHRLAQVVEKVLAEHDVPASVGLIHRAHRADAKPLVYDLMELFRGDVVDFALLRYLRLKKRPIERAETHASHFIADMHSLLERKYYLRDFGQCQRYRYYLELQVVKFLKAVNRAEPFVPVFLPRRHESRCMPKARDMVSLTPALE